MVGVVYLDARQGQTSLITDLGERGMVQEWLENKRYSRKELLTVRETSKLPLSRKQKDTLLSPIPRTLTSLLLPGELMAGTQIEEFLSHLVSSNIHGNILWTNPSTSGTVVLGLSCGTEELKL
jgi:hypothetical protein